MTFDEIKPSLLIVTFSEVPSSIAITIGKIEPLLRAPQDIFITEFGTMR